MKKLLTIVFLLSSLSVFARTVKTETFVVNSGTTVSVPLTVDDLSDVGAATFVITYDPTILVCRDVKDGAAVKKNSLVYADSGSGQIVIVVPKLVAEAGTIAELNFFVRSGTEGLFSDVTIAEADFGAKDGVTDITITNPTQVVNGMIRVMSKTAAVKRLEESFVVQAKSELGSATFGVGDAIQACADKTPIIIGNITAADVIPVRKPTIGWTSGRYELLTTSEKGLLLALEDIDAIVESETKDGLTTYFATVAIEGEVEIAALGGEISSETAAEVKSLLVDEIAAHPEIKKVEVKGEAEIVTIAADLGIAPSFDVLGTVATATYRTPEIFITDFDPKTGRVGMKVVPGEGNEIRSNLAVGCIHVYGTSDLSEKMRYISGVSIDLTPYLQSSTKGEANLTVSLGSHTFIKIKAETLIKQEGDPE